MTSESVGVAMAQLLEYQPFFAHLLYDKMKIVEYDTQIPNSPMNTLETDGRTIWINLDFFNNQLTQAERASALMHEVLHGVFEACPRAKEYIAAGHILTLPFDARFFFACQDFVINAIISECNMPVGKNWLIDSNIPGTMSTEEVYKKYWQDNPPKKGGGGQGHGVGQSGGTGDAKDNQPGNGEGGANGNSLTEEVLGKSSHDGHLLAGPDQSATDAADWSRAIAGAAAAAKARGLMPGAVKDLVDTLLEPQVDWRQKVRKCFFEKAKGTGRLDWSRLNRRGFYRRPAIIIPKRTGFATGPCVLAMDTSGSMSAKELAHGFGEVQGLLRDAKPIKTWLLWIDAVVHAVDVFDPKSDVLTNYLAKRMADVPGRGGTSFDPAFKWVEENGVRPATMIYFTDGECTWPSEPSYPVIWAITTDVEAPWGETIKIEMDR